MSEPGHEDSRRLLHHRDLLGPRLSKCPESIPSILSSRSAMKPSFLSGRGTVPVGGARADRSASFLQVAREEWRSLCQEPCDAGGDG